MVQVCSDGMNVSTGGVVPKNRWAELSYRARRAIVVGVVFDASLKAAALIDLKRRPASSVNGPKWKWATAIVLLNSLGVVPMAYFVYGRRTSR